MTPRFAENVVKAVAKDLCHASEEVPTVAYHDDEDNEESDDKREERERVEREEEEADNEMAYGMLAGLPPFDQGSGVPNPMRTGCVLPALMLFVGLLAAVP